MLRPDLSLHTGMEELGEAPEVFSYVFRKDDPYVLANKAASETEHRGDATEKHKMEKAKIVFEVWDTSPLGIYSNGSGLQMLDLKDEMTEMLWNAFEHGTNWCESGDVTIRIYKNLTTGKVLVAIEQPGEGFDVAQTFQNIVRKKVGSVLRGGGLSAVQHSPNAFNFEQVTTGAQKSFRTILFGKD